MALKPRYKRRIFWSALVVVGLFIMAIAIIPPLITLNNLKPKIQQTIAEQTGITAQINGDVHFSLLGRTTIVAHDVTISNGTIGALMFSVPITHIFDLDNAPLSGKITIYNANLSIGNLIPGQFNHAIEIHNSEINFKNREFEIIDATLDNGHLVGVIRTKQHKYDIDFENDVFYVRNQNDKLEISGNIFTDGSVRGTISMETDNINRWFGFAEPKIDKTIALTMQFDWDGGRGWKFTNIKMPKISGNITINPDGSKIVELRGHDLTYDLSFLTRPSRIFYQTQFDLDFTGQLQFGTRTFKHLAVNAIGTRNEIQIENIIADDIAINGGTIDANGAHNLMITMPYHDTPAVCTFSGTPDVWHCDKFAYDDYVGTISVSPEYFDLVVFSERPSPNRANAIRDLLKFAPRGKIDFEFADIAGTYEIDGDKIIPQYRFANGKTLYWLNPNMKQIPQFMRDTIGNFTWRNNVMYFTPDSGRWNLALTDTYFRISGTNIKEWFPGIDLNAFNNLPYVMSGTYRGNTVSKLELKIAGHEFTGTISNNNITLHTDIFDLNSFINQNYIDNYEELSFLTLPPITVPFSFPMTVSLSADALIFDGNMFKNFVYSLKPNIQTFSITDRERGNLLATLSRDGNKYKIFAQLNKFLLNGTILGTQMPLNIRDSMITGEINMRTFGNITHDLEYNLRGDVDLTFNGGYLIGIGVDDLFASANQINTFNAEYALSYALDGGESAIKTMRIIGEYNSGDFITTAPIELRLRHTDVTGELEITDGAMQATFNLTLRGTSPVPAPIDLTINPNGTREYSLSEIMMNFDATYMRDFVRTHDRF